ncbi:MAG: hypothetical protein IPQ13_10895 [Holophagaceae bacterium]|nr:hypothetical protein [Holophagaceae bacterium]
MRNVLSIPVLICALAGSLPAAAAPQDSDPIKSASGWAKADKDGSCTFFNEATRSLETWMKDIGITGSLNLSKLDVPPEKWVLDPYGNAWVVSGPLLYQVYKNGKTGTTVRLPGEVVDLGWSTKGFFLLYRGGETYLEKRDYTKAGLLWSSGKKPKGSENGTTPAPASADRLIVSEDGNVMLTNGASLSLLSFDGNKGTPLGETVFTQNNVAAPTLSLRGKERGALGWWMGKSVVMASVPASQVPNEKKAGLLLARLDLSAGSAEFLPTGVTEDHKLIGVIETEAVLMKPGGGLVFVPIR